MLKVIVVANARMENNIDEDFILAAIAKGELEQFTKLYDTYLERIYRFVFHRLPHTQTAEDVTSDIFISALEKIHTYNIRKASFSTWLYTIARNKIIDHTRTRKGVEDIDLAKDVASAHNPAQDASIAFDVGSIEKFLDTLDATQRDIVTMRVWDDLPHKDIALVLGMSEAAVKMNYSRTVSKLQSHFGTIAILLLFLLKP